jgi:hypothetical protein
MSARVIRKEEEERDRESRYKPHKEITRAMNSPDRITPAELSRSMRAMQKEIEMNKDKERLRSPTLPPRSIRLKNFLKRILNDTVNSLPSNLKPKKKQPIVVVHGHTPTNSNSKGGYTSRKYKYTNITKKPAKPKILAKKPAKPKILAKKPAKPKNIKRFHKK